MAIRRRDTQTLRSYLWVLHAAAVVEQGEAVGFDTSTGTIKPMGATATQIFMGFAEKSMTGDGTKKLPVSLPDEVEAEWFKNDDAPSNVAADDIGSEVFAKDARTVSTLATGRSRAGRVLDFDPVDNRVLVQGGAAVTGPSGATGISGSVADRTALAAVGATSRATGQVVFVQEDRSTFVFDAASTAVEDASKQLVVAPAAGTGRWLRADLSAVLKLACSFNTADAAALLTVPAGFVLRITGLPFWDVTTAFTGGTSSAIGVSMTKAGYNVKGDLLGGATGDVLAGLTAGNKPGTLGPKLDTPAEMQALLIEPTDVVRFDRITSAFTAGAGFVCLPVAIMRPST